jgi:apolipoprotein N-acyltransferase
VEGGRKNTEKFPLLPSTLYLQPLWIALAWTCVEFFRAEIPVFGLGVHLLGYSQSSYDLIRQSANTVGAYGLSFAIALVNGIVFEWLQAASFKPQVKSFKPAACSLQLAAALLVIFAAIFSHGIYHSRPLASKGTLRISVLQGNIPQSIKWEVMARGSIIETYKKLTELASLDQPDLIVWPEAAYPGYFNRDADAELLRRHLATLGIPVLLGAPHLESLKEDTAYNSAYLLQPDGQIKARYDKQLLVPFGEYVPLKPILGFLEPLAYSMGVSNFTPGTNPELFRLHNEDIAFSVLICFEDVFPSMARKLVSNGAEFLTVITNDAWFGPTSAPFAHLQASIFRAIENGVPVVRSANTGVSAFISPQGQMLGRVEDDKGKAIFITGKKTVDLPLQKKETLYRKGGWLFPYAALMLFILMGIFQARRKQ